MRGGYYTPAALSEYLCRWAIRDPSDRVIEPSCGDGSFVRAAVARLGRAGSLVAVEVVSDELEKAKQSLTNDKTVEWRCGSFFRFAPTLLEGEGFDAAVGNPPFIRFQYFDKRERDRAFALLRGFGYRPNGLANAWAAFVQLSVEMLRDGGRLAMVVPAELLQVQYAAELRFRLPLQFEQVTLVAFDQLVFPHIQQEVVLLLAEGRCRNAKAPGQLRVQQARNCDALLTSPPSVAAAANVEPAGANNWQKWTALFLQEPEAAVLRAYADVPAVHRLGDLADVDVGIVTGRNRFFVVSQEQARQLQLGDRALDVVGRTSALQSIRFTNADMQHYAGRNRSKLLHLSGLPSASFPAPLAAYLAQGEAEGVDAGYKCRIRNRWFDVPSVGVPDAFLFRQIHTAPLLVANQAGATSTDTIHRTRVRAGVDRERLCGAMINSLTFAAAEIGGRSYGGGVLELEPREAERLLVPYEFAAHLDLDFLEARLRVGDLPSALAHGDDVLLRRGCGMSHGELKAVRSGWDRLRRRRQKRKADGPSRSGRSGRSNAA